MHSEADQLEVARMMAAHTCDPCAAVVPSPVGAQAFQGPSNAALNAPVLRRSFHPTQEAPRGPNAPQRCPECTLGGPAAGKRVCISGGGPAATARSAELGCSPFMTARDGASLPGCA